MNIGILSTCNTAVAFCRGLKEGVSPSGKAWLQASKGSPEQVLFGELATCHCLTFRLPGLENRS